MCNLKGTSRQSNVQENQKRSTKRKFHEISSYHKYLCTLGRTLKSPPLDNPIIFPCAANQAFRLQDFAAETSASKGSPKKSCVQRLHRLPHEVTVTYQWNWKAQQHNISNYIQSSFLSRNNISPSFAHSLLSRMMLKVTWSPALINNMRPAMMTSSHPDLARSFLWHG